MLLDVKWWNLTCVVKDDKELFKISVAYSQGPILKKEKHF